MISPTPLDKAQAAMSAAPSDDAQRGEEDSVGFAIHAVLGQCPGE